MVITYYQISDNFHCWSHNIAYLCWPCFFYWNFLMHHILIELILSFEILIHFLFIKIYFFPLRTMKMQFLIDWFFCWKKKFEVIALAKKMYCNIIYPSIINEKNWWMYKNYDFFHFLSNLKSFVPNIRIKICITHIRMYTWIWNGLFEDCNMLFFHISSISEESRE